MRELLLLLFGQYVCPTGGPYADEVIYELPACQSVFLQEQFEYTTTLLLNLFVSFAHNAVVFDDYRGKGTTYFYFIAQSPQQICKKQA